MDGRHSLETVQNTQHRPEQTVVHGAKALLMTIMGDRQQPGLLRIIARLLEPRMTAEVLSDPNAFVNLYLDRVVALQGNQKLTPAIFVGLCHAQVPLARRLVGVQFAEDVRRAWSTLLTLPPQAPATLDPVPNEGLAEAKWWARQLRKI